MKTLNIKKTLYDFILFVTLSVTLNFVVVRFVTVICHRPFYPYFQEPFLL